MIKVGKPPILECSSKGDTRFSAFYAKLKKYNGRSIEELYQAAKIFPDGSTGKTWREAKGKTYVNVTECHQFYAQLWDEYFEENPELLDVIKQYNGFSDIFGQPGHACQAVEIYRIWRRKFGDGHESADSVRFGSATLFD